MAKITDSFKKAGVALWTLAIPVVGTVQLSKGVQQFWNDSVNEEVIDRTAEYVDYVNASAEEEENRIAGASTDFIYLAAGVGLLIIIVLIVLSQRK